MSFIIYHPRAYVRRIARQLGVSVVFPRHLQRSIVRRSAQLSHAVNWGCGMLPALDMPVLNANISGALSKIRTFELVQAAGLPTPRIALDVRADVDGMPFYQRGKY